MSPKPQFDKNAPLCLGTPERPHRRYHMRASTKVEDMFYCPFKFEEDGTYCSNSVAGHAHRAQLPPPPAHRKSVARPRMDQPYPAEELPTIEYGGDEEPAPVKKPVPTPARAMAKTTVQATPDEVWERKDRASLYQTAANLIGSVYSGSHLTPEELKPKIFEIGRFLAACREGDAQAIDAHLKPTSHK